MSLKLSSATWEMGGTCAGLHKSYLKRENVEKKKKRINKTQQRTLTKKPDGDHCLQVP